MKPTWEHREDGIAIHTHPGLHMADMTERALIDEVEELRERAETYREEREAARDMADVERKRADALFARVAELERALQAIQLALDGASGYTSGGGPYWKARAFVEERGGYTGDMEGVSVLHEVARVALAVEGNSKLPTNSAGLSAIPAPDPEADARIDALMRQQPKRGGRAALAKKGGGT